MIANWCYRLCVKSTIRNCSKFRFDVRMDCLMDRLRSQKPIRGKLAFVDCEFLGGDCYGAHKYSRSTRCILTNVTRRHRVGLVFGSAPFTAHRFCIFLVGIVGPGGGLGNNPTPACRKMKNKKDTWRRGRGFVASNSKGACA